MRKVLAVALVSLFASTVPAFAASPKAGAPCSKVGITTKVSGKKLVCTKVGKKLKWLLPKAVNIQPQVIDLTGDAARPGVACLIENLESFGPNGPMRCVKKIWVMVDEAEDSVASRAFRSLLTRYQLNSEKALSLQFVIQPNTPDYLVSIREGMLAAARLWSVPPQRNEPYPVLIGTDGTWLRSTSETMGLKSPEDTWKNIARQPLCSYAEFKLGRPDDQPWYLYCFSSSQGRTWGFLQVGAHEYTHLAQFAFLGAFQTGSRQMPPWFQEGYASYIGTMTGFASGAGYALRSAPAGELRTVTTKLADYNETFPASWGDVYPMGTFAAEALTALFGIDFMQRVCEEKLRSNSFDDVMVKLTGKKIQAWSEILQGYIDSIKANKPWTLSQLRERAA